MQQTLRLYDARKRRVLSSRDTARSMAPEIRNLLLSEADSEENLTVDLTDVATVTPSFFDELLHVVKNNTPADHLGTTLFDMVNTPEQQAVRFRAVCRVHGLNMVEVGPDHWRISKA